jgi:hypothetical protein
MGKGLRGVLGEAQARQPRLGSQLCTTVAFSAKLRFSVSLGFGSVRECLLQPGRKLVVGGDLVRFTFSPRLFTRRRSRECA